MPIAPASSQPQVPPLPDRHADEHILSAPGTAHAAPSYTEAPSSREVVLPTAPLITPDQLRANHPGIMSHIPPFMLKGAAWGLIAMAIPSFLEAGWAPKATATAVIGLVIKVFPRLIALSQEGREAVAHPEEQILTREAYLDILEREYPELRNPGR